MKNIPELTPTQICQIFGCTMSDLHRQYRKNYDVLMLMLKKSKETGKPVNGYSETELRRLVEKYAGLSEANLKTYRYETNRH